MTQKDVNFDDIQCQQSINYFVTSKRVQEFIGAKRNLTNVNEAYMQQILDKNQYFDSTPIINELISKGSKCLFLSGEGDYIVPWFNLEPFVMDIEKFKENGFKNITWKKDS